MLFQDRPNQPTAKRVGAHAWFDRRGAERFEVWEQSFRTVEGEVLTVLTFKGQKMFENGQKYVCPGPARVKVRQSDILHVLRRAYG